MRNFAVCDSLKHLNCHLKMFPNFASALVFNEQTHVLILPAPCISESCVKIRINVNFYFHTSLWCLKRFYEGLGLHQSF